MGIYDCDGTFGTNRRSFLKMGGMGFLGFNLANLCQSVAFGAVADSAKCDSVILVWLAGGCSHIDTFDPKPGQSNNGPFRAIDSTAAGVRVSEHLPVIARNMRHACIIRSLTSKEGSHERATYEMHTGYKPLGSIAHPSLASAMVQQKGRRNEEIPAYIAIGGNSFGAGFLGSQYAPFYIGDVTNPTNNLNFSTGVDDNRFKRRMDLLREVDRDFSGQKRDGEVKEFGNYYRDAVKMMYSKSVEAFDLSKESESLKKAYGNTKLGKSMMMARRLVEKGVRFVEVQMGGWDTHNDGFKRIESNSNELDPALGTLIEDLNTKGMLKRTMVICTGEFGRTPKINTNDGRDHYPRCWSGLIAGGGIKSGLAYGSTDATGAEVKDNPVKIGDLHATVCEAMGIDFTKENISPEGRPIRVVDKGQPIKGLFA